MMEQPRTPGVQPVRHETGIQWTHVPGYVGSTWNPTVGCTRVSPGCDNCYAFTLHDQRYASNLRAARDSGLTALPGPAAISFARAQGVKLPLPPQYDRPFSQVQLLDDQRLNAPLHAKRPHAYFVDSMADLFHEDVPDEFLDRVFAVMALTPQHIFMILTKRPERMREYVAADAIDVGSPRPANRGSMILWAAQRLAETERLPKNVPYPFSDEFNGPGRPLTWPLPNVWLGTSVEDQQRADERVPLLLETPAAVRFLSCEPLLEEINLGPFVCEETPIAFQMLARHYRPDGSFDPEGLQDPPLIRLRDPQLLHWVLIGGESGGRARPFDLAWARSLVEQCRAAGVTPFVKQLGSHPVVDLYRDEQGTEFPTGERIPLRLHNRHGSDMSEWPEDLRVREFPVLV
jgi:protein gp37